MVELFKRSTMLLKHLAELSKHSAEFLKSSPVWLCYNAAHAVPISHGKTVMYQLNLIDFINIQIFRYIFSRCFHFDWSLFFLCWKLLFICFQFALVFDLVPRSVLFGIDVFVVWAHGLMHVRILQIQFDLIDRKLPGNFQFLAFYFAQYWKLCYLVICYFI